MSTRSDPLDPTQRRQAALSLAISARPPIMVDTRTQAQAVSGLSPSLQQRYAPLQDIIDVANEFDLFLSGAPPLRKHPVETEQLSSRVLLLQGFERFVVRNRNDAIAVLDAALGTTAPMEFNSRYEHAIKLVDALLAVEDNRPARG